MKGVKQLLNPAYVNPFLAAVKSRFHLITNGEVKRMAKDQILSKLLASAVTQPLSPTE
jgi:hypothetical protein